MSSFFIKIIAIITMLLDHTFLTLHFLPYSIYFRIIGRISFVLFAFLVSEGCKHTKDFKKYIIRLGIFFLISEPFFDYLLANAYFGKTNTFVLWENQNIYLTLLLSVLCIGIISNKIIKANFEILNNIFVKIIIIGMFCGLAQVLHSDYGAKGVLLIVCLFLSKNKTQMIISVICFAILDYGFYLTRNGTLMFLSASLGSVFIYLYNGKRGINVKWVFYAFYPFHLFILCLVYYFFIR